MVKPWVVNTILLLAALGWVVSLLVSIVHPSYQPGEAVNTVMLAVIGGIWALRGTRDGDRK